MQLTHKSKILEPRYNPHAGHNDIPDQTLLVGQIRHIAMQDHNLIYICVCKLEKKKN